MKIAMVSGHASPLAVPGGVDAAGQSVHVAGLSAALARHGHRVTVYTRRDDANLPERVETAQGYTVVHVPAGPAGQLPTGESLDHMGTFATFLAERWQTDRPDVAHGHFWMSGIATQLAARTAKAPTVQTFHTLGAVEHRHQGQADTGPAVRLKLERLVARNATWVAATCTDEMAELTRMGRARTRVSVVPCGVDLEKFSPQGPTVARGSRVRIVSVGRMLPSTGFQTMIEALPAIANAELLIAGGPASGLLDEDAEVQRLRTLAQRSGVGDRVTFTGAVAYDDLPALLRSAHVAACTPWYEPLGIVALEAMACGVPVVATAVGAMLDTVVHDVTGRLVPPRRPRELADALASVLRDSFLRRSLGLAGRDRACARYSWDRVAADTERVYDRLVAVPGVRTEMTRTMFSRAGAVGIRQHP